MYRLARVSGGVSMSVPYRITVIRNSVITARRMEKERRRMTDMIRIIVILSPCRHYEEAT
jgi:hypothetical protein